MLQKQVRFILIVYFLSSSVSKVQPFQRVIPVKIMNGIVYILSLLSLQSPCVPLNTQRLSVQAHRPQVLIAPRAGGYLLDRTV